MSELSREFVDTSLYHRPKSISRFLQTPMKEVVEYTKERKNQIPKTPQVSEPGSIEQNEEVVYDPLAWRDFANCDGMTELFFPRIGERPDQQRRREARARLLCSHCPAILECRTFAIENREFGFWGGQTEEERHLNISNF